MISSFPFPLISLLAPALLATLVLLTACGSLETREPEYLGAKTRLLDAELFEVEVLARGGSLTEALSRYSDCVASQYALIRGFDYLRRVSGSQQSRRVGRQQNTLYTLSKAEPRGASVLQANKMLSACNAGKIPTL